MTPIVIEVPKTEINLNHGQFKEIGGGLKEYNPLIEECGSRDKPKAKVFRYSILLYNLA